MPGSQLFEGIRLYLKSFFLGSIEDDIGTEFRLEDIVFFEEVGTELAQNRLGDPLAWGSQVHK